VLVFFEEERRMHTWTKLLVGIAAVTGLSTIALVASGWEKEGKINASIHDHLFHKAVIKQEGSGCVVSFKLSFLAPKAGYQAAERGRNYYRFKARVKLSEGKTVFSPQFANNAPGNRAYTWFTDTTGEGCWAEKEHKLYNVDVEGCRNRNCRVRPFE
jgi:hypothetical protein